jgi:aspartate racemase
MKTLGIIGGMGPLATADFYMKLVQMTDAKHEFEHIHTIIDSNPSIPDRSSFIKTGVDDPTGELLASLKRLERMGADVIAMPCNTAHYFYDILCANTKLTFINMIDETIHHALSVADATDRIGLLATTGTYDSKIYESSAIRSGFELVVPPESVRQQLMSLIYALKNGETDQIESIKQKVYDYMDHQNLDAWILGCTELPIILKDGITKYNMIDSTLILAQTCILAVGAKLKID